MLHASLHSGGRRGSGRLQHDAVGALRADEQTGGDRIVGVGAQVDAVLLEVVHHVVQLAVQAHQQLGLLDEEGGGVVAEDDQHVGVRRGGHDGGVLVGAELVLDHLRQVVALLLLHGHEVAAAVVHRDIGAVEAESEDAHDQQDDGDDTRPGSDVLLDLEAGAVLVVLASATPFGLIDDGDRGGHDGDDEGQAQDDVPDHVRCLVSVAVWAP